MAFFNMQKGEVPYLKSPPTNTPGATIIIQPVVGGDRP